MTHIAIYRLRNKHRQLEQELRGELARLRPDSERVLQLKRRKLSLKDQLARLEGQPRWGV
ncbi:YdcH family protein [Phenylobacterium deserti]|uniref:DUF465 domain-containing protein n=1 Tax=Phenylobacterium deserti TaxID=1914756 RepID=A0A328ASH7_9CAUL|nr:YdcH family protein [Phenylobacterium deserti]RAK57930.1 DUF465 domain-containing protein [Phenylobacterium deserti]